MISKRGGGLFYPLFYSIFTLIVKNAFCIYIDMQIVRRAQSNTITCTVTERVTLSSPRFLMSLKSRRSNEVKNVLLPANSSTSTERYDRFALIENDTEIPLSGQIKLLGGDWWYRIYEQSSSSNLNPDAATTLLEEGILRVLDTNETYISTESTETYVW